MNKFCHNGFFQLVTPQDLLVIATSSEPMKSKVFSIQKSCMQNQKFLCCLQAKLAARATEYCLNPALYSEKQIQEFFIIEGVQACPHSSDFFTAYYKPFSTQYTYATLRFKYSHLNSINVSSLKGVSYWIQTTWTLPVDLPVVFTV